MKTFQQPVLKKLGSALAAAALMGSGLVMAQAPERVSDPMPVISTSPPTVDVSGAPATSMPPGASSRAVQPGEAAALPQVQTSGSASWVTGGTVYEEGPAFREARNQFPLNVEIYEKSGAKNQFTANADVKLVSAKTGEVVLETRTDGPYLWAKVPPGQYKLQTTLGSQTRESRVAVNATGSTRAVVVFPQGTSDSAATLSMAK